MLHKDYKDKVVIDEEVWICDYRFNDIDNKPIRHVKPKKVVVWSNKDLPKNKKVFYSEFHFREIKENGKPSSTVIGPYDNTGYRAYTGVSLNIFYSEEECRKHYKKQCKENLKKFEKAKISRIEYYNKKLEEINNEIKENC
ncbi:hypothetical protein SAMN04487895_101521 [Paenibacillus sophorae]|uniref:Uncharacterized protein n=1 Tax=Paenibacillus sophorae TaxID=1333845 RepID=A0A1H8GIH5_9BACL|nr:hypothetical protein [Paenibacillus sophorae]QWU14231.1 hypothetical protein KP014_20180 [Paenibacillus sophorae]SEN43575.1 hypothetical protein SAMN04487895_101521 [Paenibacillus sophorae]